MALVAIGCGSIDSSSVSEKLPTQFPKTPDTTMTPGKLCQIGETFRYAEQIRYCKRDVATELKYEIIDDYDELGFNIGEMERSDFKIDHFIPLCAGGANTATNLWPQHKSVYKITDPLEPLVCDLMKANLMSQAEMVTLINQAKRNLDSAPEIIILLKARLARAN